MVETSSWASGIQALFRGFGDDRFLQSTAGDLLHGDATVDLETGIRNGNSAVVEHVHSINPVTKARRTNPPWEVIKKSSIIIRGYVYQI